MRTPNLYGRGRPTKVAARHLGAALEAIAWLAVLTLLLNVAAEAQSDLVVAFLTVTFSWLSLAGAVRLLIAITRRADER